MLLQLLCLAAKRKVYSEKLLTTMKSCTKLNPFDQESNALFNPVTKVMMPENVKKDLCEQSIIGKDYSKDL